MFSLVQKKNFGDGPINQAMQASRQCWRSVERKKREKKAVQHRMSHHALPQVAPARHAAMADGVPDAATDLKATEA
jgi:hypothetical protein